MQSLSIKQIHSLEIAPPTHIDEWLTRGELVSYIDINTHRRMVPLASLFVCLEREGIDIGSCKSDLLTTFLDPVVCYGRSSGDTYTNLNRALSLANGFHTTFLTRLTTLNSQVRIKQPRLLVVDTDHATKSPREMVEVARSAAAESQSQATVTCLLVRDAFATAEPASDTPGIWQDILPDALVINSSSFDEISFVVRAKSRIKLSKSRLGLAAVTA
jgi:hypothetical protein